MISKDLTENPAPYYVRYEKIIMQGLHIGVLLRPGRKPQFEFDESPVQFMHRSAYNEQGDYIGPVWVARVLCRRLGVVPEKAAPDKKVCTVGKSLRDGKWYGWSHRGYSRFAVGDVVKQDSYLGQELGLADDVTITDDLTARDMAVAFAEAVS
jgi:hypothetical protein